MSAGREATQIPNSTSDIFPGLTVSHLAISGPGDCVVSLAYRAATGLGAAAHVNEQPGGGTRDFILYPGDWAQEFDGLAIVNLGNGGQAQVIPITCL